MHVCDEGDSMQSAGIRALSKCRICDRMNCQGETDCQNIEQFLWGLYDLCNKQYSHWKLISFEWVFSSMHLGSEICVHSNKNSGKHSIVESNEKCYHK